MPAIGAFVAALIRRAFVDIVVEDMSWRVAPSLAHAPVAVSTFVMNKLLGSEHMDRHSINNLKASLLALMLGVYRSKFSYCLVTGTRAEA